MEIEINNQTIQKLRSTFSPQLKRALSQPEVKEIYLNLKGFAQTLLKMKMEAAKNEK